MSPGVGAGAAAGGGEPEPAAPPLVSVLITAHNRADDLRATLRALLGQSYPALEVLVVDDASRVDLESVVRAEAPTARFWRNPTNRGAHASRTFGMAQARGAFILTLDDDSYPVDADAVARAVARFEREPALGILAFRVYEGLEPPPAELPPEDERYVHAFINCGQMMRAAVARQLGGYRDFFVHYAEESEFALRAIGRGWRILYVPSLLVHHRMSPIGRSEAKIAAYSFRNTLWTTLLDLPMPRALVEFGWKTLTGGMALLRRGDVRWTAWALGSLVRGLPRVARERTPISREAVRVYDALRFRAVHSADALLAPAPPTAAERWRWLTETFRRRRRARWFWDRRAGGVGEGAWSTRADEP